MRGNDPLMSCTALVHSWLGFPHFSALGGPGSFCSTSGKPHERTAVHAWRMALRATLTSPRLVGRLQRNILFRVASPSHPWLGDPVACASLGILEGVASSPLTGLS